MEPLDLDARIEALMEPLLTEKERLVELRDDLIQQRIDTDKELTKLDRILRAAGYVGNKTTTKAKTKGSPEGTVSAERLELVDDYLRLHQGEKLTKPQIARDLSISESSTNYALLELRKRGSVRLAGYDGQAKLWTHTGGQVEPETRSTNGALSSEEADQRTLAALQEIGPTYVGNVADKTGVHRSTVQNAIDRLVERGLVAQVGTQMSQRNREMRIYATVKEGEVTNDGTDS